MKFQEPLLPLFFTLSLTLFLTLYKTERSWELRTGLHKMNLFDVLTTSPHYVYRKCLGAANENWNVDLAISNDLPWGRSGYLSPLTQKRTQMDIHFSEITFSVCSFHNIITAFLITGLLWRNIEWNPRQISEVQCTCS